MKTRRPPTDKHNLYSHILALHTTGIDRYDRVTYSELQAYHRHQHLQRLADHYHIGQGLDPATQPQGWNDGGCRHTAVPYKHCFNCSQPIHKDRDGVWVHADGNGFCAFVLGGEVAAAPQEVRS